MSRILIIDDEQSICWGIEQLGTELGHEVSTASSAEKGLELAGEQTPDLIFLDVRLPGMDGLDAMQLFRDRAPDCRIVIMTAYGELRTAVAAIQKGAFEYLVKPFELNQVQQAIQRGTARENSANATPAAAIEGFVGSSASMQKVFKRIALAATSDTGVLISGESGTGKELAARAVHQYSARNSQPFVAVNIAALSQTLAESELFGHVAGAFTGADRDKKGLLVQANGGSLFLDEVADIPMPIQVKLLRSLEQGEVIPVGSTQPIKTDFRVISASHQKLDDLIQKGKFRHDLYYRLSAFQIALPPLREREGDLVQLSKYFVDLATQKSNLPMPSLTESAIEEIRSRKWYGNVRELRNAIEHAVIVARGGEIVPEHIPKSASSSDAGELDLEGQLADLVRRWTQGKLEQGDSVELYSELLKQIEPPIFQTLLDHNKGQYQASAKQLGLHRTTLKKKLDQHRITIADRD